MLSQEIQTNFNKIITYNINILSPRVNVDKLQGSDKIFDIFKENKQYFYNKFHQELIYESPEEVNMPLGEEEKEQLFNDFIDTLQYEYSVPGSLLQFLSINKKGFFDNEVICDYYEHSDDIKPLVLKGSKIVKSFKYFISNSKKLITIQNIASQVIQQGVIKGTICLSIHPLDFLSASENTYHWRSCYSLDGEYRVGSLAYLLDSCTIIAYLKGKDNVHLKGFPPHLTWNSKKWRCWLFCSKNRDMFFAGRQYPYNSQTLLNIVHKCLCSIFGEYTEWTNEYFSPNKYFNIYKTRQSLPDLKKYLPIGEELVCLEDIIEDKDSLLTFNDLLYSSSYTEPYYCYKTIENFYIDDKVITGIVTPRVKSYRERRPVKIFTIGNNIPCPVCGKENLYSGDRFYCMTCEDKYYIAKRECMYCGQSIEDKNVYHIIRNQYICEDCYNNHIIQCDKCGANEFDDCITILKRNGKDIRLCRDCYMEEITNGEG